MAEHPSISAEEVRSLAKLARLAVTDAEVEQGRTYLVSILEYAQRLKAVDTTGVAPYSSVALSLGQLRQDVAIVFEEPEGLMTGEQFHNGLMTAKAVFKHKQ